MPQLGVHIISVLHSSSALIGSLFVATCGYFSSKIKGVSQTMDSMLGISVGDYFNDICWLIMDITIEPLIDIKSEHSC